MKINRFYILFAFLAIVVGWCIMINNPYLTAIVVFVSFLVYLCGIAYITDNLNEKEERFDEKIKHYF